MVQHRRSHVPHLRIQRISVKDKLKQRQHQRQGECQRVVREMPELFSGR